VATCPNCGSENRENAKYCDDCGGKIGLAIAQPEPVSSSEGAEEEGLSPSFDEDEGDVDSGPSTEAEDPEPTPEPEPEMEPTEPEGEVQAEPSEAEEEPLDELPRAGYLVFPDNSEQPIPPSQWLIGRADLSKFLPDPKLANEISRGHLTVFQEGDRFFIEDGTTMVQRKASANKTWLVRNGSRILVTGTGRNELQDADEIDVAELVKLQFVMK
jgi:zinc-ribbon domain